MIRKLFQALRLWGDAKALSRGPKAYGKRRVRRAAHRRLARFMRRL